MENKQKKLLKMLNNGEVPAVRIGRNWRIEEEQLTEWFKAKAEAEIKEKRKGEMKICWDDSKCELGIRICCADCKAYDDCLDACNWIEECRKDEEEIQNKKR